MIALTDVQLALQQRLLTLSVCSTGAIDITATSTGYTRAAGSFITDGFAPGLELTGTDFANAQNNAAKVVQGVTALTLTCDGCVAEASGTRTLSVGLPSGRAWENLSFEPTEGTPYFEDELAGDTTAQVTVGPGGDLQDEALYVVRVHVPQNTGFLAASRYVDALRRLFPPRQAISVGSDVLRVSHSPGPFRGSLIRLENGFAFVSFTVPLWVRSANTV